MARFDRASLMQRVISALVLIPFTLWMIWHGSLVFAVFCAGVAFWTFREWQLMAVKMKHPYIHMIVGAVYIAFAGVSFYFLREHFSFELSMICISLVWASDIGAYFTGKFIGGPKLAEKISPNKTWAGFFGALLGPALLAVIYTSFYSFPQQTTSEYVMVYAFCFMTGALMGVIGQGGDLLISYFKRQSGVKDTGKLIPGHGGVLDRIDSLLPNLPVFYGIAAAVKYAFS